MAYSALFLLLVLTVSKAATVQQCSTQQPAAGGSGVPDLQQVTTIPYCVIDDCTIMRVETGKKLNIFYTTNGLLVVTPTGSHTSTMVIMKDDDQLPCYHDFNSRPVVPLTFIILVSSYVIMVHILIKKKRNAFGLLVSLYNGSIIFRCLNVFAVIILSSAIPIHSLPLCYAHVFVFMQSLLVNEALATCLLAHVACVVYYGYNVQPTMPVTMLFKRYTIFVGSMQVLFSILIILYDVATGHYSGVLLSNGYCIDSVTSNYDTIAWANKTINKAIQITIFAIFLYYYYKCKKSLPKDHPSTKLINKELIRIGAAIGATVGVAEFLFLVGRVVGNPIIGLIGAFASLVQYCVIAVVVSTKVWATYFCK